MQTLFTKVAIASIGIVLCICSSCSISEEESNVIRQKPRLIVTSDGEIDDECSMVRFLLYANEWDIEGIITSSSQYHWRGHRWAGDDWLDPYLDAYEQVYPNLVLHDLEFPTPEYLRSVSFLGNVDAEGEMDSITPGSEHIVRVLLDETDPNPVWLQAWGGTNTIARALKTIEESHPERMKEVAQKIRFFFIWEQDSTYQAYIRPHWGEYEILTIISDQFWAIAYQWNKILPEEKLPFFRGNWMMENILENHGPLCSLYKAHTSGSHGLSGDTAFEPGDFRSEGDSPAYLHVIPTGLRSMESPQFGGWGGRYVEVRNNIWLDEVPLLDYVYPEGRWYSGTAWGRMFMRDIFPEQQDLMRKYFHPMARWTDVIQNDFASRADWCVETPENANHPPVVRLKNELNLNARPGSKITLNAATSSDPDGDQLIFSWWYHAEASTYKGEPELEDALDPVAILKMPENIREGESIHIICELKDDARPQLTRYARVIITAIL